MDVVVTSYKKILNCLMAFLMVSTIFVGAMYSLFENVEASKLTIIEPTTINTSFFEDVSNGFEYKSSTPFRDLVIDDGLDNNDIAYSITSNSNTLNVKEPTIILDSKKGNPLNCGNLSKDCNLKSSPVSRSKMEFTGNEFDVIYESTLNGLKETIVINSPLYNVTEDIIVRSVIEVSKDLRIKKKEFESNQIISSRNFMNNTISFDRQGNEVFSIPQPILWDTPDVISTYEGPLVDGKTVDQYPLSHRVRAYKNYYVHEIMIPSEIYSSEHLRYPLYIDPSIITFGGYIEYQGYDNNTIRIRNGIEEETWVSSPGKMIHLDSNLVVGMNETLRFINVNLTMNDDNVGISVSPGGTLQILGGTQITRSENCSNYYIKFQNGSTGLVSDSIITDIQSSPGFEIGSSGVYLDSCLFENNEPYGVKVNQSSPTIIMNTFSNNNIGIQISPFSNPNLIENTINNSEIGINWESANIFNNFTDLGFIDKKIGINWETNRLEINDSYYNVAQEAYVIVDSIFPNSEYTRFKVNNGITEAIVKNQWNSYWNDDPHWIEFHLDNSVDITGFRVYHRSDYPTYDFKIQTKSGSNWIDQVTITGNTQPITTHTLGSSVSASIVRLYISDPNNNFDDIARIREFEILTDNPSNSNYIESIPFYLTPNTIYDTLKINKTTPGDSAIEISILDGITEFPINRYTDLTSSNIDLKNIDTDEYPYIKIKAEFEVDGNDKPSLSSWKLIFAPYTEEVINFLNNSDLVEKENITLYTNNDELDSRFTLNEEWGSSWESDWTVEEVGKSGDYEIINDNWYYSNQDLKVEGKAEGDNEPDDSGKIYLSRYYPDLSENYYLQTRFSGKVDENDSCVSGVSLTLFDDSNSSYKRIFWTTGGHWVDEGLQGNQYNYVSQEFDEIISSSIEELFEGCFGEGQINWNTYDNLVYKIHSGEPCWDKNNPVTIVDYIFLSENEFERWESGWEDSWTFEEIGVGGDFNITENWWNNSGKDLRIEGKASLDCSGKLYISNYFPNITKHHVLKSRFSGEIDSGTASVAAIFMNLYDDTNSTFWRIGWTTGSNWVTPGLDLENKKYYYVSSEFNVSLSKSLEELYEDCFGEGVIDWNVYHNFEFEMQSAEPYWEPNNPVTCVDYVSFGNIGIKHRDDVYDLLGGHIQLDMINDSEEQWPTGWDDNWTVEEIGLGGDYEIITDNWDDSGDDLEVIGESDGSTGGKIRLSRYYPDIDENYYIKTHFSGIIDANDKCVAGISLTLFDDSNSSFRKVFWTTGGHWVDEGDQGNQYNIVAQEFDEILYLSIEDFFSIYFEDINFSIYDNFEYKIYSDEVPFDLQNPVTIVDYFYLLTQPENYGYAITKQVEKLTGSQWICMNINTTCNDNASVYISLLYPNNYTIIPGFDRINSNITDLSYLNSLNIQAFNIKVEIETYGNISPRVNWIKILYSSLMESNIISDNDYGMILSDFTPQIYNNTFFNNSEIGLWVQEDQEGICDDIPSSSSLTFFVSSNTFTSNKIGLRITNTTGILTNNIFEGNQQSINFTNSSIELNICEISENEEMMYIYNCSVVFNDLEVSDSVMYFLIVDSYVTFDNLKIVDNEINNMTLSHSILEFIDTYYENISINLLDDESYVICKWTVNINLVDINDNPIPDKWVYIYNKNNDLQGTSKKSGSSGMVSDYQVTERIITRTYTSSFNPMKIRISGYDEFYRCIINSVEKKLYLTGDYDRDGLMDRYEEQSSETYFFDSKALMMTDTQLYYDNNIVDDAGILTDKYLLNLTSGDYRFQINLNSLYHEENIVSLEVYGTSILSQFFTFRINDAMTPYYTPVFSIGTDLIGINISVSNPNNETNVELRGLTIQNIQNDEIFTPIDPINDDLDEDEILDGLETSDEYEFYESEQFIFDRSQLFNDPSCGNRTSVLGLVNNSMLSTRINDLSGNYSFYVKAKSFSTISKNITVGLNGLMNTIELTDTWDWYFIRNISCISLGIIISKESGSNLSVDKFLLYRNENTDEKNIFLQEMDSLSNIIRPVEIANTNEIWKSAIGHELISKPAVTAEYLYYSTEDGFILKIDRKTGQVLDESFVFDIVDITYASSPVISDTVGICYFERENPNFNNVIVGFNLNTLSAVFQVYYSSQYSLQNSGILCTDDRFFYVIQNNTQSDIFIRDVDNGNYIWHYTTPDQYLTRPSINQSTLYTGSDQGNLYIVSNIDSTPSQSSVSVQNGYSLRSVLLPITNGYLHTLVVVGAQTKIIKIKIDDGTIDTIKQLDECEANYEDVKMAFNSPYLFFTLNGNLIKCNLSDGDDWISTCNTDFNFEDYIMLSKGKVFIKDDNYLYSYNQQLLYELDKLYLNHFITDPTLCGENIYLGEKSTGMQYGYGSFLSDISDSDQDSDGSLDGMELFNTHREILIEAEDYYYSKSTLYNISAVAMFSCVNSSYDIGYSGAQKESMMKYTLDVEQSGTYSLVIRTNPYCCFVPQATIEGSGCDNLDSYFSYPTEYSVEALNLCFDVIITANGATVFESISKGNWNFGKAFGSPDINDNNEFGSGSGGYIFEAVYYLESGSYDLELNLNTWDSGASKPQDVTLYDKTIYIVGAKLPIDNIFVRRSGLSILDSDSDDDGVVDGIEIENEMFPLNSDPDMDGISDYYEYYGLDLSLPFEYDGSCSYMRDTDLDGMRDRIELGFSDTETDPYTVYDTTPSLASIYERKVRDLNLNLDYIGNYDADTNTVTDPNQRDSDSDGLPDGALDGLFFDALYSSFGDFGPTGSNSWSISEDLIDYKIQFWEGEDFDLDGKVDKNNDSDGNWGFEISTLEHTGNESNPLDGDSDGDGMSDGWEAWNVLNPCDSTGMNGSEGDADLSSDPDDISPLDFLDIGLENRFGDGLKNIEEYRFGLNPNVNDTDGEGRSDFDEIVKVNEMDEHVYQFFINTTIPNGSISGRNYGKDPSNEFMKWGIFPFWYEYEKTIKLDGKTHNQAYPSNLTNTTGINMFLSYLYDGTEIVYNWTTDRINVLKPFSLLNDENDDGILDLECIVYKNSRATSLPSFSWIFNQIIFISDPLKSDTEGDGLTDHEEDWTAYSTAYNEREFWDDEDGDYMPNVRDHDSDNDRLLDGQEFRYYYEYFDNYNKTKSIFNNNTDCLILGNDMKPCVLDRDSDNDMIEDGDEHIRNGVFLGFMDIDGDGYPAMLDIDTDGDTIPDGWIDGYVHNPSFSIYQGGFFNTTLDQQDDFNGQIDYWEGEDTNHNGFIDGDSNNNQLIDENETFLETDPHYPDTDRDMLCDGFSPSWIPTVRQNIWNENILSIGEWDRGCTNTINDTDEDGLSDGIEVLGFDITITVLDGFTDTYHFDSDPTLVNTDSDSWTDLEEYQIMDPRSNDTDRDNKSDLSEIENNTYIYDQDTDNDFLPDGYMDINGNGHVERDERDYHPNSSDSDNDGILDGVEEKYLLFRTNANEGDYDESGTWLYMDPGIGRRLVFWYSETITSENNNLSQIMNYTDPNGYDVYSNLSYNTGSRDIYHRFKSSVCNFILIEYNETITYKFLEHDTYFDQLNWTGSTDEFNKIYSPPLDTPARSLLYCSREVHLNLSSPNSTDTDGEGLNDGEELYNLTNNNVMLLLFDFNEDGLNPLRDIDSDGDGIEDYNDLWRNISGIGSEGDYYNMEYDEFWVKSYSEDYDDDGLPNAIDCDSDDDNDSDGFEDSNQNGYYEENDESNPLSFDDDHDGITNFVENSYDDLDKDDEDIDNDGILDGQDGPGCKWWLDLDGDGLICAIDTDSDGDGLNDGDELLNGTSPWNPDTDGDGLWDGYNVTSETATYTTKYYFVNGKKYTEYQNVAGKSANMIGEMAIGTDPTNDDTDNDGLLDGEEYFGYAECGILLNRFDQRREFGHGSKYIDIPIPFSGNYSLAVFYDASFDDYIDLNLYDSTDESNLIESEWLESDNEIHFFNIGYVDNFTTYMLKMYSYRGNNDANYYLLKQGLNPLSNDTDADKLLDNEEIFGEFGFYTHPLISDSDGDSLPDWKEIYYKFFQDSEEVGYQINPLNPDVDQDGIPDGSDLEPFRKYSMDWNHYMMPYVMNRTNWLSFIYPVKNTDGAYNAEGVKNGELTREALEDHANEQMGEDYIITAFHEHESAEIIDTYTYWPYSGWNNPRTKIEYQIKTQRINTTYTNKKLIKDDAIHNQFVLEFEQGADYQVTFLVSVDETIFEIDDSNQNLKIFSEYRIFDDYILNGSSKGNGVSFNSFSLYDDQATCKLEGREYEYYGGNRIYKIELNIPKEIIDSAYNGRYMNSKKLALDLSLQANVMNGSELVETRDLVGHISIGSFLKEKNKMAYSIICKPDVSPYFVEYIVDENEIDLASTQLSTISSAKGNIRIINYLVGSENLNDGALENVAKGKFDYIAVIVITKTQGELDEVLSKPYWSLIWSLESNETCEYRSYGNIIRNEKTQTVSLPEWWDGSTDENIVQKVLGGIDKGLGVVSKISEKYSKMHIQSFEWNMKSRQIITYSSSTGYSSLTISSSYAKCVENEGGKKTTMIFKTTTVSYSHIDNFGNSLEVYGEDTRITFQESNGVEAFLNGFDIASGIFTVGYDIYTLYCDANNIISLMQNSSTDKLALSFMVVQKTVDNAYSIYSDTKDLYKTVKGIESTPKFPLVDIIIDTIVFILEIAVLTTLYINAPTWIQAHAMVFDMVDAAICYTLDVLFAILAFALPPAGTIMAAVWGAMMFILKVTGKEDDVKHGFAHLLGFVTSEDEWIAYDNVTKKIDSWVNIHNMYSEYKEENTIYLGLYPDISK